MINGLDGFFRYIPPRLTKLIVSLPTPLLERVTEIRLRLNVPFSMTIGGKNILLDKDGNICNVKNAVCATKKEMEECISLLSQGSLYTYDDTIKTGYIPIKDGGRAGLCGETILQNGIVRGFKEIYSINLRLHRHIPLFASDLIKYYAREGICGTLIYSPPAMGKTTFLRSAAFLLGEGKNIRPFRVGIVDERSEIFIKGVSDGLVDVITNCPKAYGIELLCRTMSPEVIICDEIGSGEQDAIINAQNTGVHLIASAHGNSLEGLRRRPFIKKILEAGLFEIAVKLTADENGYECEIERIL
ncbi:MAG: hypothetical protein A2Y15_04980 [Clostridiales bacterium GWF2_36_10]|nr:MAG: hypothetical protein A2Y15_04980 [Clostridiales bacterium GWF2_36_10]HAN21091.1 stage III sporulation protein AA [Clostridiales bacterium]